jgi:hypothetical protein
MLYSYFRRFECIASPPAIAIPGWKEKARQSGDRCRVVRSDPIGAPPGTWRWAGAEGNGWMEQPSLTDGKGRNREAVAVVVRSGPEPALCEKYTIAPIQTTGRSVLCRGGCLSLSVGGDAR